MSSVWRCRIHSRQLQEAREPTVVAHGLFALEQQGEAVVEGEGGQIGDAALFVECGGHAGEFERVEGREGLFDQHEDSVWKRGSGDSGDVAAGGSAGASGS